MSLAASASETDIVLPDLFGKAAQAVEAADTLLGQAKAAVFVKVAVNGKVSGARLEAEQFAAHGLAWLATYVESLRQLLHWAESLKAEGKLGRLETLILQSGFGEYLGHCLHAGEIPEQLFNRRRQFFSSKLTLSQQTGCSCLFEHPRIGCLMVCCRVWKRN